MEIRTSPHVQAAMEAKRPAKLWLAWIGVFGTSVLVVQILIAPLLLAVLGAEEGDTTAQVAELITNALTILVVALWVVRYERRAFRSVGFRGAGVGEFLGGFVGGVALFSVPMLAAVVAGYYELGASEHTATGLGALLPVLLLIPVWFVQGTGEEIVTRGYLLQRHGVALPAWPAILIVSIGFAVIHLNFDPVVLTNITLVAIFFSFLTLARGSIWLASGVHAGWNMAQGQIYGIPVSGTPRDIAILDYGPVDGASTVMSGGEFGIEGSVVATVVLVVVCLLSYRYYRGIEATRQTPAAEHSAD